MKHFNQLMTFLAILLLYASCKKDDAPPATKTDLLAEKKWKATAMSINPSVKINNGTPEGLVTNDWLLVSATNYGECVRDNVKIFGRDGKYRAESGTQKCYAGQPQVVELGSWLFSDNETKLVVSAIGDFNNDNYDNNGDFGNSERFSSYDVKELTATTLTYSYDIQFQRGGTVYTITESYSVAQ